MLTVSNAMRDKSHHAHVEILLGYPLINMSGVLGGA